MLSANLVAVIRKLHQFDQLPIKEIARRLRVSRNTVRKWVREPDCPVKILGRPKSQARQYLEQNLEAVKADYFECEMMCPALRRRLLENHQVEIPLHTLERFCKPFKEEARRLQEGFCRYESSPGDQMQIDFGTKSVVVGGEPVSVHVFVAKLGYSRRIFAKAFFGESFAEWADGIESAFAFFGGCPNCIVCDNATPLINTHQTKKAVTDSFQSFCDYHAVVPVATAIRKPRSKGKVENAVKYIKKNALVGKEFDSLQDLNNWLVQWSLTESDNRVLNLWGKKTTPRELFQVEKLKLAALKPRIATQREETRSVDKCGLIRVENVAYRVPDSLINKKVQVLISETKIKVFCPGEAPFELDKATQVYLPKQTREVRYEQPDVVFDSEDPYRNNPLQRPLSQYDDLFRVGATI